MKTNHSRLIAVFIITFITIFALLKICDFNGVAETLTSSKIEMVENLNNSADTTVNNSK